MEGSATPPRTSSAWPSSPSPVTSPWTRYQEGTQGDRDELLAGDLIFTGLLVRYGHGLLPSFVRSYIRQPHDRTDQPKPGAWSPNTGQPSRPKPPASSPLPNAKPANLSPKLSE